MKTKKHYVRSKAGAVQELGGIEALQSSLAIFLKQQCNGSRRSWPHIQLLTQKISLRGHSTDFKRQLGILEVPQRGLKQRKSEFLHCFFECGDSRAAPSGGHRKKRSVFLTEIRNIPDERNCKLPLLLAVRSSLHSGMTTLGHPQPSWDRDGNSDANYGTSRLHPSRPLGLRHTGRPMVDPEEAKLGRWWRFGHGVQIVSGGSRACPTGMREGSPTPPSPVRAWGGEA